jgi:hypothetical protein
MRLLITLAVLAVSATSAHAGEDRYGSRRASAGMDAAGRPAPLPYSGPMLSWSGKAAAPAIASTATRQQSPARPDLMSGGLYRGAPAPRSPLAMAPAPTPAGPRAMTAAPAGYAGPPAQQTAPQSLYSAPAPRAAAASPPPPPPSATMVQGGLYASAGPRFYSVHRPYGETPDPIPATPAGAATAYRPEASLAGAVALSGVGDGVLSEGQEDGGLGGVGASDAAEEAERAARREAERAAARRAPAGGSK